MDSRYRILTLGIPWTQSIPSRDVNAATRLAEASWRRDSTIFVCEPDFYDLSAMVGCWSSVSIRRIIYKMFICVSF